MKVCLTIAGSDSVAGAGIQADLRVFNKLGVYGTSVITSVTAQNTFGVQSIHNIPPDFIRAQLQSVLTDVEVHSVKVGMLSQKATVEIIAQTLRDHGIRNLVIDPIMIAKGGTVLLEENARETLRNLLLPIGKIVTPNIDEASWLSGVDITTVDDMKMAAKTIHKYGIEWVLVKGGHLKTQVVDVLYNGEEIEILKSNGNKWEEVHGTGCILSAAITAYLARGSGVREAISQARSYLAKAVAHAIQIGGGWKIAPQHEPV